MDQPASDTTPMVGVEGETAIGERGPERELCRRGCHRSAQPTGPTAARDGEQLILAKGAQVEGDVLKLWHHGSDTSTGYSLLRSMTPEIAVVISYGADNRFGHPSADVVGRVASYVPESAIFETVRDGAIRLATDSGI